jgi:hypothetical protein
MIKTFLNQVSAQAENRFYGHIQILSKYCGIAGSPFLNGYLQHGWNATDGFGNYLGKKRYANKYVWSKRCEELIKPHKNNVFSIGAPWLYLEDIYPKEKNQEKKGIVAYPSHSTSWSKMGDTHLENSEYLYSNFKEVTVVLHRYDYSIPEIKNSYEKLGHKTFCHGNGIPWEKDFDPMFLVRQRDFLNQFHTVVANVMQTAVLYATSIGLEAIIGGPVDYTGVNVDDKASQKGDGKINWDKELEKNKYLWKQELGLEDKKDKEELRNILGWNDNKISFHFLNSRAKDLVTGSTLSISAKVFKSSLKKL